MARNVTHIGILLFKPSPSPGMPWSSWGSSKKVRRSLDLPRDAWACHTTTPPHDNTYDGMIVHPPICCSTHFQTCSEWNWHVGPRACDLIIGTKMAARLPSCDSTIAPLALKVTYYLGVQSTDRLRFPILHEMTQDTQNLPSTKVKTSAPRNKMAAC